MFEMTVGPSPRGFLSETRGNSRYFNHAALEKFFELTVGPVKRGNPRYGGQGAFEKYFELTVGPVKRGNPRYYGQGALEKNFK